MKQINQINKTNWMPITKTNQVSITKTNWMPITNTNWIPITKTKTYRLSITKTKTTLKFKILLLLLKDTTPKSIIKNNFNYNSSNKNPLNNLKSTINAIFSSKISLWNNYPSKYITIIIHISKLTHNKSK